ncbi:hypothetical protein E2C01_039838 [Portunus trituberculatus]|uniref:Uncharacterized protein n=1 Tax=Portunus trituberculatus TaxID=210409 RepID=A0A5B7FLR1_PORTR|nr:hypothetical protein [Portunus trituberculatus]
MSGPLNLFRCRGPQGWKRGAAVVGDSSRHGDNGPPEDDVTGGSAGDCGTGEEEDDDEKEDATVVVEVVGVVTEVCGRPKECAVGRGEERRRLGEE